MYLSWIKNSNFVKKNEKKMYRIVESDQICIGISSSFNFFRDKNLIAWVLF